MEAFKAGVLKPDAVAAQRTRKVESKGIERKMRQLDVIWQGERGWICSFVSFGRCKLVSRWNGRVKVRSDEVEVEIECEVGVVSSSCVVPFE